MNAYELAEYLKAYANDITDYDKDYTLAAANLLILQMEEVKSLRRQLIAATSEIMDSKRWTLLIFIAYILAKWVVKTLNGHGTG